MVNEIRREIVEQLLDILVPLPDVEMILDKVDEMLMIHGEEWRSYGRMEGIMERERIEKEWGVG